MKHGCLSTLNKPFHQINGHGSTESITLVLLNMNVDIRKGNYIKERCNYFILHLGNTALRKTNVSFLLHKESENINKTQKNTCNLDICLIISCAMIDNEHKELMKLTLMILLKSLK